ncbi:MAG: hypothetical protein RL417_747 [Pseudomonadota bacterium]|jgi:hypothetical protein
MKNLVRFALGVVVLFGAAGCMPRGETESLGDVLATAEARYRAISKSELPTDVSAALEKVAAELSGLTSAEDMNGATGKIAALGESLSALVTKAGFTSRPALNEIALQYRMLGSASGDSLTPAQVKLLASRTYSVLAAELETTKFSL